MFTSCEFWGGKRFLGCTEAPYEKVCIWTNLINTEWWVLQVTRCFLLSQCPWEIRICCHSFFWKWILSVQLAYQRGQRQKRRVTHLPSAFPFKPHFIPVFHAEVKAMLRGQVCAACTLTCCDTQGNGAVLRQQDGYLLGKCTAQPLAYPLIPLLLTYLPVFSTPCRDAQKRFARFLALSLSTAPPFS